MKIAIITSSFYPVIDGVTVAVYNRVKQLSLLGHEVIIFCPDYSVIKHIYPSWQDYMGEILPGIKVINLPSTESIGLDFERDPQSKSYSIVLQELSVFQPDIIHVDEAERLSICFLKKPGIKFARQQKITCVAFFHTNYLEYVDDYFKLPLGLNKVLKMFFNFLFTKVYNSYDLTLVSSQTTERKLSNRGIKNLYRAELLGLDLEKFTQITKQPDFFARRHNIEGIENKIKLIFIGRLTPDKGWNFGLKALAQLPSKILNKIAFIVVGDGDLHQRIQEELTKLTSHTCLLGRVEPNLIPQLLTNNDIFITNSEKETRGLAVIEACAAGIPVIAPRAGGIIDTVVDGENGFLYQSGQQKEFLDKLTLLISDSNLRHTMGEKAKSKIQKLSWQQTTNNLISIWQKQSDRYNHE
jgi:glycosyltransferase involved in cell wall biosynthesis